MCTLCGAFWDLGFDSELHKVDSIITYIYKPMCTLVELVLTYTRICFTRNPVAPCAFLKLNIDCDRNAQWRHKYIPATPGAG